MVFLYSHAFSRSSDLAKLLLDCFHQFIDSNGFGDCRTSGEFLRANPVSK
jgi:hypothetical protein